MEVIPLTKSFIKLWEEQAVIKARYREQRASLVDCELTDQRRRSGDSTMTAATMTAALSMAWRSRWPKKGGIVMTQSLMTAPREGEGGGQAVSACGVSGAAAHAAATGCCAALKTSPLASRDVSPYVREGRHRPTERSGNAARPRSKKPAS